MSYRLRFERPGGATRTVDDIHSDSIDFVREHTAKSDFRLTTAYDTSLEAERFAECHLYFNSEHLFAGRVIRISSNERQGKTTVSGFGAPGYELTLGSASVRYQNELAFEALQDYLDNHATLGGTVTNPTGSADTVNDHDLQAADTTAEWNAITTLAATDPFAVRNGNVELLQTCFTVEAEDHDRNDSTNTFASDDYSGNSPTAGQGFAVEFETVGEWAEWDFTTEHEIPASAFDIAIRWGQPSTVNDPCAIEVSLDGAALGTWSVGTNTVSWTNLIADGFISAPALDLAAGSHTVRFEVTAANSNPQRIDVVAPHDAGGSRFTPNYTFDNSLTDGTDGGTYLAGPELYPPGGARVAFDEVETVFRITAASITASLDDTSNGQALGWSVDGGSTWNDTANTATVNDDPVSTASIDIKWSAVLAGYGSRTNGTPTTGFNGQVIQSGDLDIDGDTVGVIEDERVTGDHLENIQLLAERAGVRFYLNHDPDEANWTVEAFAKGDRSGSADWATIGRKRRVQVTDYANHIIGFGAKQPDGSRLRFELKDDDEIAAFGKTITRVFTDPSIDDLRTLEAAVRVRLQNATNEDAVTATIDIVPEALTPGVNYTVSALNADMALERLTYRLSGGEAIGRLEFSKPGGLGHAVGDVKRRVREVGRTV